MVGGDEVMAKVQDIPDAPNSQNMTLLKAVVNTNSSHVLTTDRTILASGNALLAEIGPSGTLADIEESVNTQISTYVVRSGDTMSEIAEMFQVSVNTILWANGLPKNPILKEGQTLVILPITGIKHIVKKGETIKEIVAKYKADIDEVLQYNDLSINSILTPGDIVIVPDAEPTVDSKATTKSIAKVRVNTPSYAGYYLRPVSGVRKSQGLHGNNGVDLVAPVGMPIYAAADGTVISSMKNGAWNGGYGNYVIISHPNGTQTLYAHNSVNLVSVGQSVSKGETIAKIGMTGKTTGPHVHFEIRGAKNPF